MRELIYMLPLNVLARVEAYLDAYLSEIRHRPGFVSMPEVWEREQTARQEALASSIRKALAEMDKGANEQEALEALCRRAPRPAPAYAALMLSQARKARDKARRIERNATIARLTREGYSNGDIAARTGATIHTTARIAAQTLRGKA